MDSASRRQAISRRNFFWICGPTAFTIRPSRTSLFAHKPTKAAQSFETSSQEAVWRDGRASGTKGARTRLAAAVCCRGGLHTTGNLLGGRSSEFVLVRRDGEDSTREYATEVRPQSPNFFAYYLERRQGVMSSWQRRREPKAAREEAAAAVKDAKSKKQEEVSFRLLYAT